MQAVTKVQGHPDACVQHLGRISCLPARSHAPFLVEGPVTLDGCWFWVRGSSAVRAFGPPPVCCIGHGMLRVVNTGCIQQSRCARLCSTTYCGNLPQVLDSCFRLVIAVLKFACQILLFPAGGVLFEGSGVRIRHMPPSHSDTGF